MMITLNGMQMFYERKLSQDFWSTLTFPAGINKSTVVENILYKGGEFEVLYANPEYVHNQFTRFSNKWNWTFKKWIDAINIDYSPLNNYDKTETVTVEHTGTDSHENTVTNSGSDTTTLEMSGSETNTATKSGSESESLGNTRTDNLAQENYKPRYDPQNPTTPINFKTTSHNTAGYDSSTEQLESSDQEYSSEYGTQTNTGTVTDVGSKTVTFTNRADTDVKSFDNRADTSTTTLGTSTTTEDSTTYGSVVTTTTETVGNIGVTTSQQMLQSELDIAMWNIYDKITDIFLSEFTLPIY